jgi:hypothetical protein
MPSTISAGTTGGTAIAIAGDTSGELQLRTNGTTPALTLSTAQNATFAGSVSARNTFGFENRIINGAMVIDQRNNGAAVTLSTAVVFPVDRFVCYRTTSGAVATGQRSTIAPANFINSLLYSVTTGATISSTDYNQISHIIEGLNVADLGWGTANAQSVTLSFWVRSSVTGTYGVSVGNSGDNRLYVGSYVINSANTWEYKSVTVPGDTSGTWLTTNGIGLILRWDLGIGSTFSGAAGSWSSSNTQGLTGGVKLVQTTGATFYITGVQLEVGSQATSFDFRSIGQELLLCQRYCPVFDVATGDGYTGFAANTTLSDYRMEYKVPTRVAGTGITASGTFGVSNGAGGFSASSIVFQASGTSNLGVRLTTSAGSPSISQGVSTVFYSVSNAKIIVNGCEL